MQTFIQMLLISEVENFSMYTAAINISSIVICY
jgi:hypothetical protein